MHGNVWEWCQDVYGEYPSGDVTDPVVDGTDSRVLRSGSFVVNASSLRSANRGLYRPVTRSYLTGFRAARTYP